MKKILSAIILSVANLTAQVNGGYSSSEILLALKKLNSTATVLYVAAHPDDENTRLLAWLANERNVRTAYLSITRGDGGQNLIGKEQGDLLGLIRTQELLAARKKDGSEQFFTRANDFGFSKNPDETFQFWNRDSILYDVVLTIRKLRPDVIICRFPTTGEGGHGHHTASAILALQAFTAAASPSVFPDQISRYGTWQATRIFWNTFNFGSTNTTAPDQLKIDVGGFNPLLGKSYGELASESRSMHKSQGFGTAKQRGSIAEYFKLLGGSEAKSDLLEGIEPGWNRISGGQEAGKLIESCINDFSPLHPERSVKTLTGIRKLLLKLKPDGTTQAELLAQKLKALDRIIIACTGLWAECFAADQWAVPGTSVTYSFQVLSRNSGDVTLRSITKPDGTDTLINLKLQTDQLFSTKATLEVGTDRSFSSPYWLREQGSAGRFVVAEKDLIGLPENPPAYSALFTFMIEGEIINVERPLEYKLADPIKGEVYKPFEILPPVSINLTEKVRVFNEKKANHVAVTVKALMPGLKGHLVLKAGPGWQVNYPTELIELKNKGDEKIIDVQIAPGSNASTSSLEAEFETGGQRFDRSVTRITYDHIPSIVHLTKAQIKLLPYDVKIRPGKIAYIPGAGDDVASSLAQLGYGVTILDETSLNTDLSLFQAIITGIRAFNTNDKLVAHKDRLMQYVQKGGNLIVQYNTNSRVGPLQTSFGPYPFTISRERVTDEKAKVNFALPSHPVLNNPNKISAADFENWVQERGIYFAADIDKNYQCPLQMNDPGEKSNEGSLIIAPYGSGNFVYTGLSFFRQLPAGVEGAYKLFSNIITLPKNK